MIVKEQITLLRPELKNVLRHLNLNHLNTFSIALKFIKEITIELNLPHRENHHIKIMF